MNLIVLVAAALALLLGTAFVATSVADRRRAALRQRIGGSIGIQTVRTSGAATLRLDGTEKDVLPAGLGWLPSGLGQKILIELGATGNRVESWHLSLAAFIGAVPTWLVLSWLLSLNPFIVLLCTIASALIVPVVFVRYMQARFQANFLDSFPDALDLMVRAVRAGLPVGDAIETVGEEVQGPVGAEFRRIHDGVTIGLDLEQELLQAAERVRLVEFRFFIVALALQRQTGGNLAETLNNLSKTLRRRKEVWLKARAIMSEARASGWVLGCLPILSGGVIYFLSPTYMQTLLHDPRGTKILGAAVLSLTMGVFVMRTMIKRAVR